MCCPSTKVIKSDSKSFSSYRTVTRRQVMRHFTSTDTDQCRNGSSSLLIPYRGKLPLTSDCCHLPTTSGFNKKADKPRSNHFYQQAQVSQGCMPCRRKENRSTEVHGSCDLEPVKLTHESASSRPKLCTTLKKKPHEILLVHCPLLALVGREQTVVRDQLSLRNPKIRPSWF